MRPLPPGYNPKGNPRPRPITNFGGPRPRPGVLQNQPLQPGFGPPQMVPGPDGTPIRNPIFGAINPVRPGEQLPPNMKVAQYFQQTGQLPPGMGPSSQTSPIEPRPPGIGPRPRSLPFASAVGPSMQQAPMQQFSYGGRAGYQMGGGIMGLENSQEESIFPRLENLSQNLGQAEQTLGTPYDNQSYGSPIFNALTGASQMNLGGRSGYQEGGMGMEMMQPQMQDPMMQEQMMQSQMQDPTQGQLGEGDNALLTIIQLLIEQGVPPEQAEQLARQILQVFAQGGEPAVEAFADQLEQQEGMQEPMMMAEGGLTSIDRARNMLQRRAPSGEFLAYINPEEAGILKLMGGAGQDVNVRGVPSFWNPVKAVKSAVKGVSKAVKSIVKSPIGKIALTIGATMLMGPAGFNLAAGQFGITNAFLAGAVNAGAANLLVQGITTGKINPKEALLAGAIGGVTGSLSSGTSPGGINPDVGGIPDAMPSPPPSVTSNLAETFSSPNIQPKMTSGLESDISSMVAPSTGPGSYAYVPDISKISIDPAAGAGSPIYNPGAIQTEPNIFQKGIASVQDFGTNLMNDPLKTIQAGIGSLYDTTKENIGPLALGFGLGTQFREPLPGEDPNDYNKLKAEHDSKVKQYYDLYSGNINPTAPLALAANGGRIGYEYGSMPMGEPKRNPAGIMELDYRAKGGFVPPIGIKEKADDIPAMLSNNEFVFTANAVRNAGEGNVNKGAQRMYSLMKQLEAGGVV